MITYNTATNSITLPIDDMVYLYSNSQQRSYARYGQDYSIAIFFEYLQVELGLTIDHFSRKVSYTRDCELYTIAYSSPEDLFKLKLLYSNDEIQLFNDAIQYAENNYIDPN